MLSTYKKHGDKHTQRNPQGGHVRQDGIFPGWRLEAGSSYVVLDRDLDVLFVQVKVKVRHVSK